MTAYTPPSIPELIARLAHADGRARSRAAEELVRRGPAAREAVPALIAVATDDDRYVRLWAVRALVAIDPTDPAARNALLLALNDPDRDTAQVALRALTPSAEEFDGEDLTALAEAAMRNAQGIFDRLAEIMAGSDPDLKFLVPDLVDLLASAEGHHRSRAAEEINDIGWRAKHARPAVVGILLRLLRDDGDPFVRLHAAEALHELIPDLGEVLEPLVAALDDPDPCVRAAVVRAIGRHDQASAPAVPRLVPLLADPEAAVRSDTAHALGSIRPTDPVAVAALARAVEDSDADVRRRAVNALGAIGAAASSATAVLTRALDDPELRPNATSALASVGASVGIERLIAQLSDPNDTVRSRTADALATAGPAARAAQEPLLKLLEDSDASVRGSAARALGAIGADPTVAVPAVVTLLDDESDWVRRAAANGLAAFGPVAVDAIPRLAFRLLNPPEDSGTCSACAAALGKIGRVADCFPALLQGMNDNFSGVQESSAAAIGDLPLGADALPTLIERFEHDNSTVRDTLVSIVAKFGAVAIPHLLEAAAEDRHGSTWQRSQSAHAALVKLGAPAVPAFADLLRHADAKVRAVAANALAEIGSAARAALPELAAALADEPEVRWAAVKALATFGPDALPVVPALIAAVRDSDWRARGAIADALVAIGPGAVPELRVALRHPDADTRGVVVSAIGKLAAPEAAPDLIALLGDLADTVRMAAADALGAAGPAATAAVPALTRLVEERDPAAAGAASTLGKIGPAAADAIPALVAAANEYGEDGLPEAAAGALAALGDAVLPPLRARFESADYLRRHEVQLVGLLGRDGLPILLRAYKGLDRDNYETRGAIESAVTALDSPPYPLLNELARDPDPELRVLGLSQLVRNARTDAAVFALVLEAAKDPDADVRASAIGLLSNSDWDHRRTVPVLVAAISDPDDSVRDRATEALGELRGGAREAVPALIAELNQFDEHSHYAIVGAISSVGAAAVPPLVEALKDPNPRMRTGAACALGGLGDEAEDALAPLTELLSDPEPKVRAATARAVTAVGGGEVLVPRLVELVADPDNDVCRAAVEALANVHALPELSVPALVGALERLGSDHDNPAARALAAFGADGVAALVAGLRAPNPSVRRGCATALQGVGQESEAATDALIAALGDSDEHVRSYAADALGYREAFADRIVPALVAALKTGAHPYSVAGALMRFGNAVRPHVTSLLATFPRVKDDWHGKNRVSDVIAQFPDALPEALAAFTHPDEAVRDGAAMAVWQMYDHRGKGVGGSVTAFASADPAVRRWAAKAVLQFDPKAAEAVPLLAAALGDDDSSARARAAEWLGRIGSDAAPAAGALVAALGDAEQRVRFAAVCALGQIKPAPADTLRELERVRDADPDTDVRKAAATALAALTG